MKVARRYLVLAVASVASSVVGQIIPADKAMVRSLDGTWRFKIESFEATEKVADDWRYVVPVPVEMPEPKEKFWAADYRETDGWHDLKVPGNWETAGHSPATYNQPDNALGWYREEFDVPAAWQGQQVRINFDGVQNGCEVWVNGQPANVSESSWGRPNYHESGWTAFQVDLTPMVKFGEKNVIALRVNKNSKSANMDSGDYHYLGGVYRPVTLYATPATHVDDYTVRTTLHDGGARVKVRVDVKGSDAATAIARATLGGVEADSRGTLGDDGWIELDINVDGAKLWSAEHPHLYDLVIELMDKDGKVTQRVKQRVGLREVAIKDGVFLVNNTPVKFTGLCRHDIDPNLGTAVGEEHWRREIMLAKAANCNAIRTSHYPYGKGFYELCDELGMYVADELPYCWTPTNKPELQSAFDQRARETLRRDKNFASVVLWSIGNENKPIGQNVRDVEALINALDPTRPSVISQEEKKRDDTDLTDSHYGPPNAVKEFADTAARTKTPHILLENPNVWDIRLGTDASAWDQWYYVFSRNWDVFWATPEIPGSFFWEWMDRAVIDQSQHKLYGYDKSLNLGFFKVKGIVDAWRNPRPQYFHVKMVQSPIRIALDAKLAMSGAAGSFEVDNRHSFTDLSAMKVTSELMKGGKPTGEKRVVAGVSVPPLSKGTIKLELGDATSSADAVRVHFHHADGRHVVSHQFALSEPTAATINLGAPPAELMFPEFNFVTNVTRVDAKVWRTIDRSRGRLVNVKINGEPVAGTASDAKPFAPRRGNNNASDAAQDEGPQGPRERLNTRRNDSAAPRPDPTKPRFPGANIQRKLSEVREMTADLVLDTEADAIMARVTASVNGGEFKYAVEWIGRPMTDVQELGWIFTMPKLHDRFSWDRKAIWTVYPDDHIGRPAGTATPDSAKGSILKWERADQFDFNSSKYDCNWASLTGSDGSGLGVAFAADARHHVRGGWSGQTAMREPYLPTTDGREGSATTLDRWLPDAFRGDPMSATHYTLVVNRHVSPPIDISTPSVRDRYLQIERDAKIEGEFKLGAIAK